MSTEHPRRDERSRRETIRRRLYRPDATDDDRRRFAELDEAAAPAPQEAAVPTRRRRRAVPIAGAAVLLAGLTAVVLQAPRSAAPTATPVATAPATVGRQIAAGLVRAPASTPTPIATTVAGVPTTVQRVHGTGTGVVAIDTRTAQRENGTMLVMLTSGSAGSLGWFATRPVASTGGPPTAEIVAERTPEQVDSDGPPTYSIVGYDGAPATRLLVEDPETIGWTLTIGFLPRRTLPY